MWTPWGPWAHCSAECGGGVHSRSRLCENGSSCPGCSMVGQRLFTKQKWQSWDVSNHTDSCDWPARTLNLELKRRPAQMIHPHISEWINPKLRGFTCLASTSQLLMIHRSTRPVTWRPAPRCVATPPGPPGCRSTSATTARGRSRDSDTPVGHCSLTPSSSSWARKRRRRGSAPMTAREPARLTVSAGSEPWQPSAFLWLLAVQSCEKLSQVFPILSAGSTCYWLLPMKHSFLQHRRCIQYK